jgi:enoyl-CoA hydratase
MSAQGDIPIDVNGAIAILRLRNPARRAYEQGVVSTLTSAADIDRVAAELFEKIAANAPLTIRAGKAAIRGHLLGDPTVLAEADRLYAAADGSTDYAEGRRAFAERRPPRFTGR